MSLSQFLSFANSTVTFNNLGGQGPVPSPEEYIQYEELLGLIPPDVVLRVTNTTPYMPSFNMMNSTNPGGPTGVDFNGLSGEFGIINVLSATSVGLKFAFLNKTDETPFTVSQVFFSWFDLDNNVDGDGNIVRQEKIIVADTFSTFFLDPFFTTVNVTTEPGGTGFCSTVFGNIADNPMDPMALTPEQESKAVTIVYEDISEFEVELSIGGPPNEFGRNLIFGGLSSVIASPPPPSPPPSPPPAPFAPGTGFSPPPPGFVIKSDPHFQGLDGNVFDFDGEAGNVYTLLLQPDDGLELIARFSTAYTTGIDMVDGVMFAYKPKGTWLTSVAVRVTADDAEEILVVATSPLGGAATQTRHGSVLQYAGDGEGADLIQVEFAEHGQTDIISFISENLEGKITVVPPPANWEVEEENKAGLTHLNIGIDRLSTSNVETLDGVLGISATGRHPEGSGEEFLAINKVDKAFIGILP